jgi:hypothetical protein
MLTRFPLTRPGRRPPTRRRSALLWLLPVLVSMSLYLYILPYGRGERAIAALLGLGIVAIASRRPDRALLAIIILLPFHQLLLAWLYRNGLSSSMVRSLAIWKEAMGMAIVVAGIRQFLLTGRRADLLDKLALAYIGIVVVYALFPHVFAPDAPIQGNIRSLGFRSSAGFVILMLGARHAKFPPGFSQRLVRVLVGVGVAVAGLAMFEFFFDVRWNDILVNDIGYSQYSIQVLSIRPFRPWDLRVFGSIGGREVLRVGSVLLTPIVLGFFLLPSFAVAIERVLRRGARAGLMVALVLVGAAVLLTQTRSALIGALVIAALAFRPAAGRRQRQRAQFTLVLGAVVLLALPAAVATGLAERTTGAVSGSEESAQGHIDAFFRGVDQLKAHPAGQGLGTSAGTGQRFFGGQASVNENYYIQVGTETGMVAMAVFVALTVVLVRTLRREARRRPTLLAAAVSGAGIGLAVGAFFLHVWADIATAWTFWGVAGAALSIAEFNTDPETDLEDGAVDVYADASDLSPIAEKGLPQWNSDITY